MSILRALVAAPVTCITLKVILETKCPELLVSKNELGKTGILLKRSVLNS